MSDKHTVTFTVPHELFARMQAARDWFGELDVVGDRFEKELERSVRWAEELMDEQQHVRDEVAR